MAHANYIVVDGKRYTKADIKRMKGKTLARLLAVATVSLENAAVLDENGEFAAMTEQQKREAANREEFTRYG
jgi:hypothetical protein